MKIKLTLTYDGTDFVGWQIQKNGRSVQEEIENAVFAVTGEKVRVTGSGRTDAGVHASGQVASFSVTTESVPADKYKYALNVVLPKDVRVIESVGVSEAFDARKTAKRKTYEYSLYISDAPLPLRERYATAIDGADVTAMKSACEVFVGEHDFSAFCASGCSVKSKVRTVYEASVEKTGDDVVFTVTGNGFLYNMVRLMVGAVVAVGNGKLTIRELKKILGSGKRPAVVKNFPAKGLTLKKVEYDG